MPKITVSSVRNGEKVIISENEISVEEMQKIKAGFDKAKAEKKEMMKKTLDNVPDIVWEILRYANHHSKEECLLKYPEHESVVNSIIFND